jgi:hypothetical protein
MPTDDNGFEPARGTFTADEDFVRAEGGHHIGWNKALDDALLNFRRNPGDTYPVTVVFTAEVLALSNPGRITKYIVDIL